MLEDKQRWNEKISGTKNLCHQEYFAQKYFGGVNGLIGLSLGCGRGDVEMKWAATGKFARIDAFDLSENRIAFARKAAKENGLTEIIDFRVGDVYEIEPGREKYDFIFTEGSLHHFSPLTEIVVKIKPLIERIKPKMMARIRKTVPYVAIISMLSPYLAISRRR